MSTNIGSVTVRGDKVTLRFEWTGFQGKVVRRQQITVSRRQLERALLDSKVEVPWQGLI